jgi:hypothetical protein
VHTLDLTVKDRVGVYYLVVGELEPAGTLAFGIALGPADRVPKAGIVYERLELLN